MVEPPRYAKRQDGSLVAYRTSGGGPIDLVFSVGISNCEVLWDHPASARFLDRLARFSRLIVFDFRGSGASDGLHSAGFPTWENWTDDLVAVLDDVGSARAAIFVESVAVPSAIIFAATYPERTSALVMFQASVGSVDPALVDAVTSFIETGWGTASFCAAIAPSMSDDELYLAWVARTQRLAATPRLAAALIGHHLGFDASGLLTLIQAPTLVLHSDSLFAAESAREVSERIEGARFIELDTTDALLFGTKGSDEVVDHVEEFLTGARPAPTLDRVLATVLFTDIVGSTDRAAQMGDRAWRRVLDAHDAVVRDRVGQSRGRLVKTTGDGAFATFDGPARGIQCAKELRASLAEIDIDIRAGLHTGEVELRDDDVGGIAVHIGARVAAKANAGEILVSSTVKDLVVGSDLRFDDRGTHDLKGVPGEWRLFAAVS
jgi:class 3 adenylate cyclase